MTVAGGTTSAKELSYDQGGNLKVLFSVRPREGGTPVAAKADAIVLTNTEMATARTFGTPGAGMNASIEGKPLFPFKSGYSIYAGSCTPAVEALQPESAAKQYKEVPVGGSVGALVQLPALYLTVKRSSGGTPAEQTAVSGALVTLTDLHCTNSRKEPVVRRYTTTAIGSLGEYSAPTIEAAGVPTGEYEVCASKGNRRIAATLIVKRVEGTSLTLDLAGSGSTSGEC
jgi:hypothetical protein